MEYDLDDEFVCFVIKADLSPMDSVLLSSIFTLILKIYCIYYLMIFQQKNKNNNNYKYLLRSIGILYVVHSEYSLEYYLTARV